MAGGAESTWPIQGGPRSGGWCGDTGGQMLGEKKPHGVRSWVIQGLEGCSEKADFIPQIPG